jgi:hypothetical protein
MVLITTRWAQYSMYDWLLESVIRALSRVTGLEYLDKEDLNERVRGQSDRQ